MFFCSCFQKYVAALLFVVADDAVVVCSDVSVHYVEVEKEERESIVEEALEMRKRRQALSRCEPKPDLILVQPISCLS